MTLNLSLFSLAISWAESMVLFGFFWLAFRPFKASGQTRDLWFLLVSYPGLFSMGGGTIAFVVPVPLLLGAPVWIATLSPPATSVAGWVIWRPALFLALESGSPSRFLLSLEIAAFLGWLLVAAVVVYRLCRRRPAGEPAVRGAGVRKKRRWLLLALTSAVVVLAMLPLLPDELERSLRSRAGPSIDFVGRLVDQDGRPVAGARVEYRVEGYAAREVLTDDNGVFAIGGQTGERLEIRSIEKDGYDLAIASRPRAFVRRQPRYPNDLVAGDYTRERPFEYRARRQDEGRADRIPR